MIHHNSDKKHTKVNLDAATLASPSGEEHDVPSQSSCLIPEYVNLRTSGLRRRKIIQERQKRIGIPKIFGLTALFASVDMTVTKSILPETASFAAKLLQHEERAKYSPYNLPSFNNPIVSKTEEGNYTFTLKEATSQPDRLDLVEDTKKR